MKDAYDEAVEYLTANPHEIYGAWCNPFKHRAGFLFGYCSVNQQDRSDPCGCLTQVAGGHHPAATDDLTRRIRGDHRIPRHAADVRPKHLPVFAEWQRRMDAELGRTPPARKAVPA